RRFGRRRLPELQVRHGTRDKEGYSEAEAPPEDGYRFQELTGGAVTDVVIDGVRYVPESGGPPSRIGIGITTRNRPEALKTTLENVRKHFPPGARLVVVDDASEKPVPEADFRFPRNVGIARAKNKCLKMLQDCEHLFLLDDDV